MKIVNILQYQVNSKSVSSVVFTWRFKHTFGTLFLGTILGARCGKTPKSIDFFQRSPGICSMIMSNFNACTLSTLFS